GAVVHRPAAGPRRRAPGRRHGRRRHRAGRAPRPGDGDRSGPGLCDLRGHAGGRIGHDRAHLVRGPRLTGPGGSPRMAPMFVPRGVRRLAAAATMTMLITLSACGGGDDPADPTEATPKVSDPAPTGAAAEAEVTDRWNEYWKVRVALEN